MLLRSSFTAFSTIAASALLIGVCVAAELPEELTKKLADDNFQIRETAQAELLKWAQAQGDDGRDLLFQEHHASKDPEVRVRCMNILKEIAKVDYASHGQGFMGISMDNEMVQVPGKDEPVEGVLITRTMPGLPAEKAGLRVGDVLLSIDGKSWPSPATTNMRRQVINMKPTTKITLQVLRDEKVMDVDVTLTKRPLTADNLMLESMPERLKAMEDKLWEEFFQGWKERHDPGA